jgi:O-antigen ligase
VSNAIWFPVAWLVLAVTASKWLALTWGKRATTVDLDTFMATSMEGNPLERNVFLSLVAIGLLVVVLRGRDVFQFLARNWPFLLFFGYCLVSVAWSDFPGVAFKRWIKALGDLAMVTIVLTDPHPSHALKRFVAWTGFVLVPLSVLYMEFYPEVGQQLVYSYGTFKTRYVGITDDKNMLGVIGLLFGLGALWRVLQGIRDKQGVRPIAAHGMVLLMTLWISYRANSMTAFGSFLLMAGMLVIASVPMLARKRMLVRIATLTVLGLAAVALFFDAGAGLVQTLGRDPTLTGRNELWGLVLSLNTNKIFGAGFESFWMGPRLAVIWDVYWWHPNEAHNGYIEVLLNLGAVGLCLLLLIIVRAYRNVIENLVPNREVGGLTLVYFLMGLVYSGSEAGFRMLHPVWICFMLGALVVTSTQEQEAPVASDSPAAAPALPPVPYAPVAATFEGSRAARDRAASASVSRTAPAPPLRRPGDGKKFNFGS